MLSVKSLLNPAPPGPQPINRFPPSPASSSPTTSFADDSSFLDRPIMPKQQKIPKDAAVFNTKSRPKGVVNFYPYERLDDASLRLVRRFQVFPLGKIQEYCRHIPYNSGKKDFYVKTGRESFEVFQYVFKVPGEDVDYVVMWDYNVGLVRMTPFFKCCKYPKTTPAKMLNANPGLKEITHSITGGSIMAQGYWMPYHCAKAVCATFCQHIAGALIPIFGPDFPSMCTPSDTPEYSRMVIDPAIVVQAAREAEHFRRMYNSMVTSSAGGGSPKRDRRALRNPYEDGRQQQHHQHPHQHPHPHHPRHSHHHHHHHHRPHKAFVNNNNNNNPCGSSPYGTDTDGDMSPPTSSATTEHRGGGIMSEQRYLYSPVPSSSSSSSIPSFRTHSGWTPANMHPHYEAPGPSPWLSAVPRLTSGRSSIITAPLPPPHPTHPPSRPYAPLPQPLQPHPHAQSQHPYPSPIWRPGSGSKRSADHIVDSDYEYDGGESSSRTAATTPRGPSTAAASPSGAAATIGVGVGVGVGMGEEEDRISSTSSDNTTAVAAALGGADKNAALLLMNLSVRDSSVGSSSRAAAREGVATAATAAAAAASASMSSATSSPRDGSFPRIKRVRSNSM